MLTMENGAETTVGRSPAPNGTGAQSRNRPLPETPPKDSDAEDDTKNIVLFSDGTGNSSGKLFKTNVWRLYEAIDLGPSRPGTRNQIAYYDDGVGTSGFKPLAILGGIFGVGLRRNVLDIYKFACRNYRPGMTQRPGQDADGLGDHIYGFGFSRGAFTMRVAIALIADQGLVPYTTERDLKRKASSAYREFCSTNRTRYPFSPMRLVWACGHILRKGWHALRQVPAHDRNDNFRPVIRFAGMWDTVAAYGGPIAEITRAIDNWFYPLSMPNYELSERVQVARHALALDDERDSFHPLLWDEVHEADLIHRKNEEPDCLPDWVHENRLEQVWFAGMHADVGGGYPDESLSYVSLLWMIGEAQTAGLRTLDVIVDRYRALANSFGPIHNSRAGVAAYYRYQPRKIAAWLHPANTATLSLRDPAIRGKDGPKGLLTEIKLHESVVARIAAGTDSYAPIVIPADFRIVPPGLEGENQPQEDSEGSGSASLSRPTPLPLITAEVREHLQAPAAVRRHADMMETVWDRVWLRRVTYFATLLTTAALLLMPVWIGYAPEPPILGDGRTWIGGLIGLLRLILPAFLDPLIQTYEHNALYFLLVAGLIVALMRMSTGLELRLRERARAIWNKALDPARQDEVTHRPIAQKDKSLLARVRTSRAYQRSIQVTKWHILPNLLALLMFALLAWLLLGIYTQARLPSLERGHLCRSNGKSGEIAAISRDFDTRATCNSMVGRVTAGTTYVVTFDVVDPWYDGSLATNPEGVRAADMAWGTGYLGVPLRRVVSARYLQPVFEIRPDRQQADILHNVYIYPLKLERKGDSASLFSGEFVAKHDGELFMFANDAVFPFTSQTMDTFNTSHFYERSGGNSSEARGNRGSACVIITRSDLAGDQAVSAQSSICRSAAERALKLDSIKDQAKDSGSRKRLYLTQ